jgi:hypothetical protein
VFHTNRTFTILSLAAAAALAGSQVAKADFTGGNLVVVQGINDGTNPNDAAQLQEFTPAGGSVNAPLSLTASGSPLVLPNSSLESHEGQLTLSTNGQVLTLGAYEDALNPTDSLPANADTPTNAPRVVAVVSPNGSLNTSTVLSGASDYNGVSIRQVTSIDGTQFIISGNGQKPAVASQDIGGLRFATLGASSTSSLNPANDIDVRTTAIFQTQLFGASGSSNNPTGGHNALKLGAGVPTSGGGVAFNTIAASPSGVVSGNQSPNFDVLGNGATVLYLSDSSEGSGALDKWVFQSAFSTWLKEGSVALSGLEDLATSVSGSNVDIYGSTATGIFHLSDTTGSGSISGDSFSQIVTAATGTTFYGLSFAPTPEPASGAVLLMGAIGMMTRRRRHS